MRKRASGTFTAVLALTGWVSVPRSLSAATPLPANQEWGWETLVSVTPGMAIWTVVTFGIMVLVVGRFAWKPMLAALDAREQGIQKSIDDAKQQRQEAEALLARHRQQLAEGRRQAQAMMAESREAADRLRKELEEKAREEVRSMLASARREIKRERNAAVEVVRREAVDVALAAASRLLAERMDSERDRRLVLGYIDQIGEAGGAQA